LAAVLGLFIVGGTSAQVTIDTSSASPGAGSVLVDANGDGVAVWQAASAGSQGPQGKQGPAGADGAAGAAGDTGPQGAAGADGGSGGAALSDGLWGFWPMYEGGGLIARDVSGNGHAAALDPAAASGIVGWQNFGLIESDLPTTSGGLDLDIHDSSTGAVGTFGRISGTPFGGSMSVTAFIRVKSYPTPQNYGRSQIVSKQNSSQFFVNPDGHLGTWINNGTMNISTGKVNIGQWHYVAVTFDANADVENVYIDGVLDTTHTQTGSMNVNGDVAIGAALDGYYHFEGLIDELRIYNRVLTAAEIIQLWNPAE
jgi:hypothetical protein